MPIKNNGTHSFPDNALEILDKSTAQRLEKRYTFQADPFLTEKGGKLYIFYETLSFRNSKDTLRCHALDRELVGLEDIRLEGFDDLKCHLSFPYLIHINDQLFIIPEPLEREEVILFQSVEFPAHWKQVKVLISGTKLTGDVFISINETCYLLSTAVDNEMIVHSADHIYEQWQRITPSLKMSNPHHRGTGAPYLVESKMYFPTRGYTPKTYGKSICIKELMTLNDANFVGTLIEQINSSVSRNDGVRTLSFSNNYIIYDTEMNKLGFLSILKKISCKCMVRYRNCYLTKRNQ